jgi:hypothetical protein
MSSTEQQAGLRKARETRFDQLAELAIHDPVKLRWAARMVRKARQHGLVTDDGYPVDGERKAS